MPINSETPQQDPWANIFPPTSIRPAILPVEGSPAVFGMYDPEDQVYESASGEEHRARWSILPAMERIMGWPGGVDVDESDDGTYESSFIDDEDSEHGNSEAVEISSDNDEITGLATTRRRIAFSEGSEDEDEKVSDEFQKKPRRLALGTRRQVLSDSDMYVF